MTRKSNERDGQQWPRLIQFILLVMDLVSFGSRLWMKEVSVMPQQYISSLCIYLLVTNGHTGKSLLYIYA